MTIITCRTIGFSRINLTSWTLESDHATHTLQNQTGALLNPKVLGMAQETAAKLRRAKADFFRQARRRSRLVSKPFAMASRSTISIIWTLSII